MVKNKVFEQNLEQKESKLERKVEEKPEKTEFEFKV